MPVESLRLRIATQTTRPNSSVLVRGLGLLTAATAVDSMARGACAYDTPLTGFLSTDCAVN